MILTGKLFKFRYALNGSVQPPVIVHAEAMAAADVEVLLYAAGSLLYAGEEIRILSATEINVEAL